MWSCKEKENNLDNEVNEKLRKKHQKWKQTIWENLDDKFKEKLHIAVMKLIEKQENKKDSRDKALIRLGLVVWSINSGVQSL